MSIDELPLILEPDDLEARLGEPGLLVVDLSKPENHASHHVPGAVHLDYGRIIAVDKPVAGLLPEAAQLAQTLGGIGLSPETWLVAYDDEGGGKAGRLLYTLDVIGHPRYSLLDGGLHAWVNEGHAVGQAPAHPRAAAPYPVRPSGAPVADADYIRARLDNPDTVFLDTRSSDEYTGARRFAERGGHIPGAVHYEWTQAMDMGRNLRLRPEAELRAALEALGVTPDKEIVCYCQTHHRSSHTYVVLKALGYTRVKGYPGAWSEWGNRSDTPVAL